MKKILLSFVAFVFATVCLAQGSLLATLSHEGEISAYYGASALKAALTAAADGDVITLSSGQFTAVDITKAITLRGAGMSVSKDSTNTHEATFIHGDFQINLADSLQGRIIMEGLYVDGNVTYQGTLKNAQFLKCRFNGLRSGTSGSRITNTSFIHCRFADYCRFAANSNASFINCVVNGMEQNYGSSNIEMANCFVHFLSKSSDATPSQCVNTYFKNCILTYYYNGSSSNYKSNFYLPTSCTAYNCIGLGGSASYNYNIFSNIAYKNKTNQWIGASATSVFKTYNDFNTRSLISDIQAFELTDEAKAKYLGVDGTQVGIHGGNLPYNEQPSTPQITKCNVAAKSTADGKLSVEIEVKAAEY